MRGNPYQLLIKSDIDSQNLPESSGTHLSQMPLMGQPHYPSHPTRWHGRNGDRHSGNAPDNGTHHSHSSGGGHGGPHGTSGGHDDGLPDDPYEGGSDGSSSSEFERLYRYDWHTWQHEQFKQSMIDMNNSIIDLLKCHQRIQNDTTHAFYSPISMRSHKWFLNW